MRVPQILHLSNQTFNSDFIEFVWQFPFNDDEQDQVILKVFRNGTFYLEGGRINRYGDYKGECGRSDYSVEGLPVDWFADVPTDHLMNYARRFFIFEEDLLNLANETVTFLNTP